MNLAGWMKETSQELKQAGIEDSRSELFRWFFLATGRDHSFFVSRHRDSMESIFSSSERQRLEEIFAARLKREPLEYIAGEAVFWKRSFAVGPGVLIPRQDSELLVELAMAVLGHNTGMLYEGPLLTELPSPIRVMDLCTGTGCVGISLVEELFRRSVQAEAILTDISDEALYYARGNIERSPQKDRLHLVRCDLFPDEKDYYDRWGEAKCSLILSNPPYITTKDMAELMPEVGAYEPAQALHGGDDGLLFYRRILDLYDTYLREDGMILFEHGYDQGESVPDLCREFGFSNVSCFNDYAGNPRVTLAGKRERI